MHKLKKKGAKKMAENEQQVSRSEKVATLSFVDCVDKINEAAAVITDVGSAIAPQYEGFASVLIDYARQLKDVGSFLSSASSIIKQRPTP